MPSYRNKTAPKKNVMIGIKVGQPDREVLENIAEEKDRPLGYVARELMLRGLAAYNRDGQLKEPESTSKRTVPIPRIRDDLPKDVKKRKQG